ncbi:hypothetical protein M758_UG336800 [Ceratodon purpureus]|nr:hypothetical protein M758_UG336800 [Ceratodon purpureus]
MQGMQKENYMGVQRLSLMVDVPWYLFPSVLRDYKHVTPYYVLLQSGSVCWTCLAFVGGCIDGGRKPGQFMTQL